MHDPETWNTIYSDVLSITHLKNRTIRKLLRENLLNDNSIPKIRKFIRKNTLNGKSIPEVAAIYDGVVYANRPEYAYCKIIFPKENYENITEAFKSLGFKVRDNIPMEFDLDYSRDAINLPYIYYEPGGEYELTGSGRTIAIIDSGIEDSHDDFPGTYPDSTAKIIFWNDTTPERYSCCVDEFGHGVHVASIAAGTGSASEGLYKGVAPDAKLKIWKVSVGASVSTEAVAEATWQAITQGADVISMSLSAPATSDMCTGNWYGQYNEDYYDLYEAVTNAISNGITVVSSAGNTGPLPGTIRFPACVDGVIAVGSTLKKDYPDHYYEIGKD
ncbi:MAG: S8 family serine peptidase, partial [Candidatus Aenigmarchaeota archaeon]|nr:S8 family serine peptidase [Candidatus Aenigmarchaeota archaeon]